MLDSENKFYTTSCKDCSTDECKKVDMEDLEYREHIIDEIISYCREHDIFLGYDEVREQLLWRNSKELCRLLFKTKYTYGYNGSKKKRRNILLGYFGGKL
jgi:hypothetical protein